MSKVPLSRRVRHLEMTGKGVVFRPGLMSLLWGFKSVGIVVEWHPHCQLLPDGTWLMRLYLAIITIGARLIKENELAVPETTYPPV